MDRLIDKNTEISNQIISCKENKKTLRFDCNSCNFYKIHIDSSDYEKLLNEKQRCDYAILKGNKDIVVLIELKGNDIKKAYNQIIETKENFCKNIKQIYGAIVYGGTPRSRTNIQNLRKSCKREMLDLFIKEKQLELQYNYEKNIVKQIN